MTESSSSRSKFWSLDQRLTFFLACLILIIFVILPLAGLGILGKFVVDIVLTMLMIAGVIATQRSLGLQNLRRLIDDRRLDFPLDKCVRAFSEAP